MNRLHLRIADLHFTVECALSLEEIGLPGRLSPFVVSTPARATGTVIRWEEARLLSPLPADEIIYDPKRIWRMFKGRDGYDVVVDIDYRSRWNTRPPRARLYINDTWDRALLMERRAARSRSWSTILTFGPAELIVRTRIICRDGLVFHACGLDDNGRGLLMAGRSGAGKSTQALLWDQEPGVVVLNDDRVAVRLNADGAMIYGSPWSGIANIAQNHQAPLSAILLIEKAKTNELVPLSSAEAMPLLMARAFLPYWNPGLMATALGVLERLLARIPVYRFRCRPESSVIPLVRAAL